MNNKEILNEVLEMINMAKSNGVYNLNRFVEQPYKGFNTGNKVIRSMPLGNEDNFYNILSTLKEMKISNKDKEDTSTVLWVFRGLQEDATIRRNERRLEEVLGMKKVPYPYDDDSDEYNEIIEDKEIKGDLIEELSNLNMPSYDETKHEELKRAIESLSERQKTVASMILLDGYKACEVSKILGIAKNTVSITFERAKNNINKFMRT